MTDQSSDARHAVMEWAETAPASDLLPLSRVESKVGLATGHLERDVWLFNVLEGIAWLAAIVAPAAFIAFQTVQGRQTGIETDVAITIAGVSFCVALLGPVMSLVRWSRRGRRPSGMTKWTNRFILICSAVGLVCMFIRVSSTGGSVGGWPVVGILLMLACVAALLVQRLLQPVAGAGGEYDEGARLALRNEALGALRRRGIINDDVLAQAVATSYGELYNLNDIAQEPGHGE